MVGSYHWLDVRQGRDTVVRERPDGVECRLRLSRATSAAVVMVVMSLAVVYALGRCGPIGIAFAVVVAIGTARQLIAHLRQNREFPIFIADSPEHGTQEHAKVLPAQDVELVEVRRNDERQLDDFELVQMYVHFRNRQEAIFLYQVRPSGAKIGSICDLAEHLAERWRVDVLYSNVVKPV